MKIAAISAFVLTGVGLFVFYPAGAELNEPITLSDGNVVYFGGVTFGTNHLYRSKLASIARILPRNIQNRLAQKFPHYFQTGHLGFDHSCLVVWLDWRNFPTNVPVKKTVVRSNAVRHPLDKAFAAAMRKQLGFGQTIVGIDVTGDGGKTTGKNIHVNLFAVLTILNKELV